VLQGLTQEAQKKAFKNAPPDRTQVIGDQWDVPRCEMHKYLTPEFYREMHEWNHYRRYGFRFSGGWAEQPAAYIDLMDVFEEEFGRWQSKRLEKK
jgi:hypothetical protein